MSHWRVCSYAPVHPGLDLMDGCIGQTGWPSRPENLAALADLPGR